MPESGSALPREEGKSPRTGSEKRRFLAAISPSRISGIYVLAVLCIIFSVWSPETFPEIDTVWQILNSNAVGALAALTLIVPLATGVFDLSVPYVMTLSGAICTYAIVNDGWPVWVAVAAAIGASLLVGVMNSVIIVLWKVESLVATLASGFVIQAVVVWRTNNEIISGVALNDTFRDIAFLQVASRLTLAVVYVVVLALILGLVLQGTATGRRMYATGFNADAARLAGVKTARLQVGALLASAGLAGFTGIVLASSVGAGSSTAGTSYLLPAFAGVFLGATQIYPGRFNPWGTIVAVVLLGTLTTGFGLADVDLWIQQLVSGVVLIIALALAGRDVRRISRGSRRNKEPARRKNEVAAVGR